MHLHTRNINTAFRELVELFAKRGEWNEAAYNTVVRKSSRVGDVLMIDEPVTITYSHPRERVLFNTARDSNPFFLLYESLHMLAGRRDIAPLSYYASGYARHVQDGDYPDTNGAYGYRWRHAKTTLGDDMVGPDNFEYDQLQLLIAHLKADPNSRRAVLQMWNVEDDLLKVGTSKDVCCNTAVYFSLREEKRPFLMSMRGPHRGGPTQVLDMTVTNRSNDLIWGTLGSDYVNLGFLQEYMAAHLGVEVGVYNQFSNNLHVYTKRFKPEEWLAWYDDPRIAGKTYEEAGWYGSTVGGEVFPLVKDPATFERELPKFVDRNSGGETYSPCSWSEPFLNTVAQPLLTAFRAHKEKWGGGSMMWVEQIKADDWRIAATKWLERRLNKTA
jgi:thymidylate synthase